VTLPEFMPMVWQYANLSCFDQFGQSPVGRIVVSSSCEVLRVICDGYFDESWCWQYILRRALSRMSPQRRLRNVGYHRREKGSVAATYSENSHWSVFL